MAVVDKHELVASLIKHLETDLQENQKAAEAARKRAIESEGRMKTRYDTHKEEQGALASALSSRTAEKLELLHVLKSFPLEMLPMKPVQPGSVVQFHSNNEGENWIFIVPGGSAYQAEVDGITVSCLAPNAPLVKKLLGKVPGDVIPELNPYYGEVEILYTE